MSSLIVPGVSTPFLDKDGDVIDKHDVISIVFLIFVKVIALCSMAASSFVMRDISLKLRGGSVQDVLLTQSILFCLSVGDFFSAFFTQFLSTWMVPSDVPVALASGSVTSCTIQGILGHLFYGVSAFSNASLAVVYCLIVRFGWKDEIKDWHLLPFIMPIITSMVLAFIPLYGQNYNYNGGFYCDITASPFGCDWKKYPDAICTRGQNVFVMLIAVGVVPFEVALIVIIAAMGLLTHSVLTQERRMDRYQREGVPVNRSMTKETTRQGLYYIAAFVVGWLPWFIYASTEVLDDPEVPVFLFFLHGITRPLQGVLNALVYFHPRYKAARRNAPSESRTSSALRVLKVSVPAAKCCFGKDGSKPSANGTARSADMHGAKQHDIEEEKREEEESASAA